MTDPRPHAPRRRPTPKPIDRDLDTESKILEAARRVFVRRGTAGARVQDIAAEAGVNQALVHYYFGNKAHLAERVFLEAAGRLMPALAAVADPAATLEQTIERFVHAYIDTVRHTPFVPAYLLAEAHQYPGRLETLMQKAIGTVPAAIAGPVLARLRHLIDERVAAGTMRPMSPRQVLVNVLSLVVFPFAARPVIEHALALDDAGFEVFLDERKRDLPAFIMSALRP